MGIIKTIDSEGNDIGSVDRKLVVKRGLRHQIVSVLIYSETEQSILLQRRSEKRDSCPGMWDSSASGHVNEREDAQTAIIRETREEIGVVIDPGKLKLIGQYNTDEKLNDGYLRRQTLVYAYNVNSMAIKTVIQPEELAEVEWIKIADVVNIIINSKSDPIYKSHKFTKGLVRSINFLTLTL